MTHLEGRSLDVTEVHVSLFTCRNWGKSRKLYQDSCRLYRYLKSSSAGYKSRAIALHHPDWYRMKYCSICFGDYDVTNMLRLCNDLVATSMQVIHNFAPMFSVPTRLHLWCEPHQNTLSWPHHRAHVCPEKMSDTNRAFYYLPVETEKRQKLKLIESHSL